METIKLTQPKIKKSFTKAPKLPAHLEQVSAIKTFCFISTSIFLFVVPALAAFFLWQQPIKFFIKLTVMLFLLFFSQQGLHLLGWVGHEGFHLNLHRNKYISAYMGIFFASIIFSFMQIGASISHWNHHAFTNQKQDPDIEIFTRFKNFWSRIFFARLYANRIYLKNTLTMALGKKMNYPIFLPFSKKHVRILALTNLSLSIFWMSIYIYICITYPVMGIICIIIPHLLSILYSSIRSYIEHADTGIELFENTRTRSNIFFTLFYFGNNYHLEHHLYPHVPCYHLPEVHEYLKMKQYFNNNEVHIVTGVLAAYRYATKKHQYPLGFESKQIYKSDFN
jgi:fatty acid desaturase